MSRYFKKSGFSLAEVIICFALLSILVALIMPVIMTQHQDGKFDALVKESFSVVGEMTLACQRDTNYTSQLNTLCTAGQLGQYFYDHMNFSSTYFGSRPSASQSYTTTQNYFTFPLGSIITNIGTQWVTNSQNQRVVVNTITLSVPLQSISNTAMSSYTIYVDHSANRYTTVYGYTGTATTCVPADVSLHITATCP